MNVFGKSMFDYDKVQLEGINELSDYYEFISGYTTNKCVFGEIIVCQDSLGMPREIISGKYIPCVEKFYDSKFDYYAKVEYPNSPYRGIIKDNSVVTREDIKRYKRKFNNDKFLRYLNNFINMTEMIRSEKEQSFVRKLIKK